MFFALGMCVVWTVGAGDYYLTVRLLEIGGPDSEVNPIARLVYELAGADGLLCFKIVTLLLATISVLLTRQSGLRRRANLIVAFMVIVSLVLAAWWEVVSACGGLG